MGPSRASLQCHVAESEAAHGGEVGAGVANNINVLFK